MNPVVLVTLTFESAVHLCTHSHAGTVKSEGDGWKTEVRRQGEDMGVREIKRMG